MWGQATRQGLTKSLRRIIPTRVGTSDFFCVIAAVKQDHPHACGDKYSNPSEKHTLTGSSPRVWGQVDADFSVDLSGRIIPTRVGTSYQANLGKKLYQDHPHACGDK